MGTTIILSRNDLEADEIARVALAKGCDLKDLALKWEKLPDFTLSEIDIDDLASQVILVECPAPEFEERLRRTGRVVHVVDHHIRSAANGELIDRRSARSSLEQVLHLLGEPVLSEHQLYIAANDAGYWPGLLDLAARLADSSDQTNANDDPVSDDLSRQNQEVLQRVRTIRALELGREQGQSAEEQEANGQKLLDAALSNFRAAIHCGDVARLKPFRYTNNAGREFILLRCSKAEAAHIIDGGWLHLAGEAIETGRPIAKLDAEFLLLTVDDAARRFVTGLAFSGSQARASETPDLFHHLRSSLADATIELYAGGGVRSSFIDIRSTGGVDLSRAADLLLDELLDGERPIWTWRSHFLQFMQYTGDELALANLEAKGVKRIWPTEPERIYLSEQIRQHWALPIAGQATGQDSIRPSSMVLESYELVGTKARLEIKWGSEATSDALSSGDLRLRLHFAPLGVVMVEWIAEGAPAGEFEDASRTWCSLLHKWPDLPAGQVGTLAELLNFNESARYIFSPFQNAREQRELVFWLQTRDGHETSLTTRLATAAPTDRPLEGSWFEVLRSHLCASFSIPQDALTVPTDSRSRVVTGVSTLGGQPVTAAAVNRQDNLLARLAGVDGYSPDFAYEPTFTRQELEGWRYRRFADQGTHVAINGYAFAAWTNGWFGTSFIVGPPHTEANSGAARHISHDYWRLYTLGAAQSFILSSLTRELGKLAGKRTSIGDTEREDFAEQAHVLRDRINGFSHAFWTDEASTEMQGRDLYNLILRQVGVRDARERLVSEVERLDQAELLDQAERAAEREARFGAIVLSAGATIGAWALLDWTAGSLLTGKWFHFILGMLALLTGFFVAMRLLHRRAGATGRSCWQSVVADAREVLRLVLEFIGVCAKSPGAGETKKGDQLK